MKSRVQAILLETSYAVTGPTGRIAVLGKTMADWVNMAVAGYPVTCASLPEESALLETVRPLVDTKYEFTVVLFTDTPLLTKKTVEDALNLAYSSNRTVLKMTRGYVFRSDYLKSAAKIYTDTPFYFEEEDFVTAFNFKQVGLISDILKNRILNYHMENGVQFEDLNTVFVGCDVKIGKGVVIAPNCHLRGKTVLKDNVRVHAGCTVEDCVVDEGATLIESRMVHSYIGKHAVIGPFANLRPDNIIGDGVKVGDFVELKNCQIGRGSKLSHLTYAGDVVMGENCNVGAGVVFANYDGKRKSTTHVGNNAFIGSSSTLVAPLSIGDGAFIAAGSVITEGVTPGTLAIGRARQVNKPDWTGNKYHPKE